MDSFDRPIIQDAFEEANVVALSTDYIRTKVKHGSNKSIRHLQVIWPCWQYGPLLRSPDLREEIFFHFYELGVDPYLY